LRPRVCAGEMRRFFAPAAVANEIISRGERVAESDK
jgi:hypothetical protein